MGLQGLLAKKRRVQFIQGGTTIIQLDVSTSETHERESPTTDHPVENGQEISDNILIRPQTLSITGIISDTPLNTDAQLLSEVASVLTSSLIPPAGIAIAATAFTLFSALAKSKSPSVAAYGQLLQLQVGIPPNGPQPVDVLTSLSLYQNMWITKISAPREANNANTLVFTASMKQIIIVSPQSVNVAIFANPYLGSNAADLGDKSAGIKSGYEAGYTRAQAITATTGKAGAG